MELCILNKTDSKIDEKTHVKLLWVASVIGETINVSGFISFLTYLYLKWDDLNEKVKYTCTIEIMTKNPKINDEYLEKYKQLYETIRQSRTIKHKTRDMLIATKKAENIVKHLYADSKTYLQNYAIGAKYFDLMSITDFNPNKRQKPILVHTIDDGFNTDYTEKYIQTVVELIKQPYCIHLVDSNIKEYLKGSEINNLGLMLFPPSFIYDFLFELPAPETLNSTQLHVVRNELSNVFWKYFNELTILNEEIVNISFIKHNFKQIVDLYHQKTKALKPQLQKTIDENEFFNQLKTSFQDNSTYKVYVGITSFTNIMCYYHNTLVLDEKIILYAKEEIEKLTHSDNSHLFLFLDC